MPGTHVFLSYLDRDHQALQPVRRLLREVEVDVIDGKQGGRVDRDIADSVFFLTCFSANRDGLAEYEQNELAIAVLELQLLRHDRRWLVPITINNCPLPSLRITDAVSLSDFGNQIVRAEDASSIASMLKRTALAQVAPSSVEQEFKEIQAGNLTMVGERGTGTGRVVQKAEKVTVDENGLFIGRDNRSDH